MANTCRRDTELLSIRMLRSRCRACETAIDLGGIPTKRAQDL